MSKVDTKVRVKLLASFACPPYYGANDDVIDLPLALAIEPVKQRIAVCLKEQEQKLIEQADENKDLEELAQELADLPAEVAPPAENKEPENKDLDARVEEHLAGLDELFEKQNSASEVPAVSKEKPAKGKGKK